MLTIVFAAVKTIGKCDFKNFQNFSQPKNDILILNGYQKKYIFGIRLKKILKIHEAISGHDVQVYCCTIGRLKLKNIAHA